jgi:hypothetical protein
MLARLPLTAALAPQTEKLTQYSQLPFIVRQLVYLLIFSSNFSSIKLKGQMAELVMAPGSFLRIPSFIHFLTNYQVKVILTTFPGHESGAGSSPVLFKIRPNQMDHPGFFFELEPGLWPSEVSYSARAPSLERARTVLHPHPFRHCASPTRIHARGAFFYRISRSLTTRGNHQEARDNMHDAPATSHLLYIISSLEPAQSSTQKHLPLPSRLKGFTLNRLEQGDHFRSDP